MREGRSTSVRGERGGGSEGGREGGRKLRLITSSASSTGILCGKCNSSLGVGMLSMECRRFTASVNMYYWLMPILGGCRMEWRPSLYE